jgi:CheY-like chemotaxis protein
MPHAVYLTTKNFKDALSWKVAGMCSSRVGKN